MVDFGLFGYFNTSVEHKEIGVVNLYAKLTDQSEQLPSKVKTVTSCSLSLTPFCLCCVSVK